MAENHEIEQTEEFCKYTQMVLMARHMAGELDYTIQQTRIFRLTWLCGSCNKQHIDRGVMTTIVDLQVCLMQLGVVTFEITDEAFALHIEAVDAEQDDVTPEQTPDTSMEEFLRGFKR